jgi:signal transduction histidine kinase
MLKTLLRWFQPPTFPDDEDKTRNALLLNVVLNTLLTTLPVIFAGVALDDFFVRREIILSIITCGWLALLGVRFTMLAGRVPLAGTLTVLIIFIATTFALYNRGSIRMPVITFYIVAITIAGLTINRGAIIWTAIASVVASTILLMAEKEGALPKPDFTTVNISQGITLSAVFTVISILLYIAVKSRDEALTRLRHELVERALSREREARRREMMERVIQIGKVVTEQTSDLRTALLKIRNNVRDNLDFDRAAIFLYDPKDDMMRGTYGTDRSGNLSEEWDLKFSIHENAPFKTVLDKPDGYYFTQDYETERGLQSRPGHVMRGVKYYASVAVWAGDKPVALIIVDQLISGRIITNEQVEALRFFAGYAGLAIENARLSEREQSRQKMMEKVIRIGKEVTKQTTHLRTALLKIRDSVRNELDFDRAAIFLYDSNRHLMQGSYGTDRVGNLSEEWDLRFDSFQVGYFQTVLSRPDGFYFTQDYEGDLNISSDPTNTMRGVKHYATVACWGGDKPVAVICVDQLMSGRPITDEQLEALRLFAGYAGLAIENTRLNTELEGRMRERENFIQELGNRNAELERFTYTVSHDLRSPLVTIKGFLGMLNKDMLGDRTDRVASDMKRIADAADKMDGLLSNLLQLSRVGRIINPPEEIDLVNLAYVTLETIDGRIRAKNITTHISPDLPAIYGDRVRIGEVLENLIDNAAKYMGEQPDPHIEIGVRSDNGEQIIYVKDNGMGIEPQYLQRIFGLFEKLNPTGEGTGIGLALIKRIVEVHGGRIWAESDGLGKGSTFCFTVPDNRKKAYV